MPDSKSNSRTALFICLLLALLTLGVYFPVIRCDFVHFDDPFYVTKNAEVQRGLSWENVRWALTAKPVGNWHPLTWISHMLDCQIYGLNPAGHHATNLALHTANSILLFLLLRRMTGAQWRSAFVAALFALHPLHVESVAWVSERKDVLSTFFWALTIWAYVRYARKRSGAEDRKVGPRCASLPGSQQQVSDACFPPALLPGLWTLDYGLVLLFFTLGLLSKPMLVTLPCLLLLLDFWPLNRVSGVSYQLSVISDELSVSSDQLSGGETPVPKLTTQNSQLITLLGLIVEKLPLFVLSCLCCAATLWSQGFAVDVLHQPFYVRLENAFQSSFGYMLKMVWPAKLVVLYPFTPDFVAWQLGLAVLVVVGLSVLAVRHAKRLPYLFTGWFWFLGTLVPVIGLVQVGLQSMADRYTYVPLIGLFIVIAWGGYDLARRWQLRSGVLAALAILLVLACIPVTRAQLGYWKDSVTLFEQALRWTADNYVAENDLGVALSDRGEFEVASEHFRKAIRLSPEIPQPHYALAMALLRQNKLDEAYPELMETIRIQPNNVEALNNLGLLLVRQGKTDEGIVYYRIALNIDPNSAESHCNLGYALVKNGRTEEGIEEIETALRMRPGFPNTRSDLIGSLSRQGKLGDATARWTAQLQREPGNADAHVWLGLILMTQKDYKAALGHLKEAARLRPNDPELHLWLGDMLGQTGTPDQVREQYEIAFAPAARRDLATIFTQRAQALAAQNNLAAAAVSYEMALSHDAKLPSAHVGLAVVLNEQGKFAAAAAHLRTVLETTPNHWEAHDVLGMVLIKQNETTEALRHFSESARINPSNVLVRCHLAMAFEQTKQIKEAVAQYQEALRLNPGMPAVLNNLAWILASHPDPDIRNGAEAVRLAEQACEITGYKGPLMVGTLSAAYAEAGRFDEAVEAAKKAQALAAAAGNTQLAEKDQQMIQLFLNRQPFRTR